MASSQAPSSDPSATLEELFVRILNTNDDAIRTEANDSIITIIDSYVRSDSIFSHTFSNLRFLGQVESPDSKLKIITWNLVLRNSSNKYFCYLIRKGKKNSPNLVYELKGENKKEKIRNDILYNADNWYGALYYKIIPFMRNHSDYYLLLGLDNGNTQISRKIIDVLSFPQDGGLILGNDSFIRDKTTRLREVFEYSSDGIMTLRIQSRKMIVFDHLDAYSTGHQNDYDSYGAGLTFDGYVLKRGSWHFTSNIDVKNKKK